MQDNQIRIQKLTTKELRKPKTTVVSEVNTRSASSNVVMLYTPGPIFFLIHVTIASLHKAKFQFIRML